MISLPMMNSLSFGDAQPDRHMAMIPKIITITAVRSSKSLSQKSLVTLIRAIYFHRHHSSPLCRSSYSLAEIFSSDMGAGYPVHTRR